MVLSVTKQLTRREYMKSYYLVMMHRFGSLENHSYVLGLYTSYELAQKVASKEEFEGGCEYLSRIVEVSPASTAPESDELDMCTLHHPGDEFEINYEEEW